MAGAGQSTKSMDQMREVVDVGVAGGDFFVS